jgi:hypothetical protein
MQYTKIIESEAFTPVGGTGLITEHNAGYIMSSDGTFILFADSDGIKKIIIKTGVISTQKTWSSLSITTPTNNVFFCKNASNIYCVHSPHGSYNIYVIVFNSSGAYVSNSSTTSSPNVNGLFYKAVWLYSSTPYLHYIVSGSVGVVNCLSGVITQQIDPNNESMFLIDKLSNRSGFLSWDGTNLMAYLYAIDIDDFVPRIISNVNYISGLTSTQNSKFVAWMYESTSTYVIAPLLESTTWKMRYIDSIDYIFAETQYNITTLNDSPIILSRNEFDSDYLYSFAYDDTTKTQLYFTHWKNMLPLLSLTVDVSTYTNISPFEHGVIRSSSTDCVIDYEELTDIKMVGLVNKTFTFTSDTKLSNFVYRFYNSSDELISVAKIISVNYSNGIYSHSCVDIRYTNSNKAFNNIMQPIISSLTYSDYAEWIFGQPGTYGYTDPALTDTFTHNAYKEMTQTQFEELLENNYSTYIVHYPDGMIQSDENGVVSGVTLSYANNNFYSNSLVEASEEITPSLIVLYGSNSSIKVEKTSNNLSGIIMKMIFPAIDSVAELSIIASKLSSTFQQLITVTVNTTEHLYEGQLCTLNVSAKSGLHPILNAYNGTMYISNESYDLENEGSIITLKSAMIFKRRMSNDELLFQQFDALSSAIVNGKIYLPYFQATNYNPATSAWVSQACADNTVSPLNLYNVVENEGGFTWSSSNRSRVYVPSAGWYLFTGRVQWAGNASGYRQGRLRINGSNADAHMIGQNISVGSSADTIVNSVGMGYVGAGSYVELCGLQDTDPSVSLNMKYCTFNIVRLSL